MLPDRLKQLRTSLHLPAKAFADHAGCSYGTYRNYETGRQSPPLVVLETLAEKFDVQLAWLLQGKGQPFSPDRGMIVEQSIEQIETYSRLRGTMLTHRQMAQIVNVLVTLRIQHDVEPSFEILDSLVQLNQPDDCDRSNTKQ